MKKSINTKHTLFFLFTALLILSCSKEEEDLPELINEEEVITNVKLVLSASGLDTQTIDWAVDQNNSQTITLKKNTAYEVNISFLDQSNPSDIEDITEEVEEEADEHQVFYEFSDLSISYASSTNDTKDSNGNPVYLKSVWTASSLGSGTVRAFLIHEPTTKTSSSRDGFGGETDVAIDIPITVID